MMQFWNHYALNAAMETAMIKVGGFKEMFDSPESLAMPNLEAIKHFFDKSLFNEKN